MEIYSIKEVIIMAKTSGLPQEGCLMRQWFWQELSADDKDYIRSAGFKIRFGNGGLLYDEYRIEKSIAHHRPVATPTPKTSSSHVLPADRHAYVYKSTPITETDLEDIDHDDILDEVIEELDENTIEPVTLDPESDTAKDALEQAIEGVKMDEELPEEIIDETEPVIGTVESVVDTLDEYGSSEASVDHGVDNVSGYDSNFSSDSGSSCSGGMD
jgi:hypothetical protein